MKKIKNLFGVKVLGNKEQKVVFGGTSLEHEDGEGSGYCATLGELCAETIPCCETWRYGCSYVGGQSYGYCTENI